MSRMHECPQVIHSTVEVLLHQMLNHQYTSLLLQVYFVVFSGFFKYLECLALEDNLKCFPYRKSTFHSAQSVATAYVAQIVCHVWLYTCIVSQSSMSLLDGGHISNCSLAVIVGLSYMIRDLSLRYVFENFFEQVYFSGS